MKITVNKPISSTEACFLFCPEENWEQETDFNNETKKIITNYFNDKSFKGELGEILQIPSPDNNAKKYFLAGTGRQENKLDDKKATSFVIRKAKKIKAETCSFQLTKKQCLKRSILGTILGNYEFKVGDTSKQFTPKSINIISNQTISDLDMEKEISLAESINKTRDYINLPPNLMTPPILAQKSKELEATNTNLTVNVLGVKEMKKLDMGSLLGVGQGSYEESQCIVFEYKGGKKDEAPIAFVGKGVCFDAGGYNIKPTGHIEDMKSDMSGAATVLGIFNWIAKTSPQKNIVGVIGAVENLVNGRAFKPGDIITAMNGKTIEITNTDAEGRLVLADCLYYTATKLKPSKIIDLATLTGACIAALGYEISAVMGNNEECLTSIKKAAQKADEEVWELPITKTFRKKIEGNISDLKNWTAGVGAGSVMGGAFLEAFVEKTPWVHIDIAGTAFDSDKGNDLAPVGATGVMVETLRNIIEE